QVCQTAAKLCDEFSHRDKTGPRRKPGAGLKLVRLDVNSPDSWNWLHDGESPVDGEVVGGPESCRRRMRIPCATSGRARASTGALPLVLTAAPGSRCERPASPTPRGTADTP